MGDIITTISIPHSTGSIDQTAHSNVNIKQIENILFTPKYLPDPGVSGVRSMGPGVPPSLRTTDLWNFADVTMADDETNSIQLMMPI